MLSKTHMKQKILVVDDEEQIRTLLTVYFRKNNYDVLTASTSEDSLRVIEAEKPDLAVLDIGLGQEDGLKLLGRIKATFPQVKVIMLTGMGFVEDLLQEAQQREADGYVSKVNPLDDLLATVHRVLKPVGKS